MSIARHHAEWLSLLEISGPFLSMPVLLRAFPQGLDAHDPDTARLLRLAYAEWQENPRDPALHTAWVRLVLERVLELPAHAIADGQAISPSLKAVIAEQGEVVRPDLILTPQGKGDEGASRPLLLIHVYAASQDLDRPLSGHRWKASPATRMLELLRATDARLGLVTNGEQWMLVDAPRGGTSAYVSWYAALWLEEPLTLRAFRSLLGVRRFFGMAEDETLPALLAASVNEQQEVTDQLGHQVRRAVELLIRAIDRADREQGGELLGADVLPERLYEAALTVMMRLVILFSAEERGLLLLGDALYDQYYAVSTLRAQLREAADQQGEEVLERRFDGWPRLLATFRAVYGGVWHQDFRLPAYGGSLFDPERFPFLEGRTTKDGRRSPSDDGLPSTVIPIHNRTVLHLLEALQILQVKVPGGGPAEARRLSFRALDIEQIGHVYEGLLDHTAVRAVEPVLGLVGTKDKEPEVPLGELERFKAQDSNSKGMTELMEYLREQTGRSESALRRALQNDSSSDTFHSSHLRAACANDAALYRRALPYAGLVRDDDSGLPVVILPGSAYVTAGTDRRSSGTHYTPKSLTEPIVQRTLEPLIYIGPAEGRPREQWQLRPAAELLQLKVCDMAMGSGAFLVQTCRYLGERLVEAWEAAEAAVDGGQWSVDSDHPLPTDHQPPTTGRKPRITPEGQPSTGAPGETLIPEDTGERLIFARRIVADRCLYGVDKNPLAVEMAKLSLWLVTLAKDRPFGFLDHALKYGDSLVGADADMFERWAHGLKDSTATLFDEELQKELQTANTKRQLLESFEVRDVRDAERKAALLAEADAALARVKQGCDLLIGTRLLGLKPKEQAKRLSNLLFEYMANETPASPEAQQALKAARAVRAFHWPFEFPEVFAPADTAQGAKRAEINLRAEKTKGDKSPSPAASRLQPTSLPQPGDSSPGGHGGFSAFVGNPPFVGGQRISGTFGDAYLDYLKTRWAHTRGSADICAYFFLRAFENARRGGTFGLIATNTIAQGDTRQMGLDFVVNNGGTIYNAVPSMAWPGVAAVFVSVVHILKGAFAGDKQLADKPVPIITALLDSAQTQTLGDPKRLAANADKSFQGSIVLGMGFVLTPEEAQALIDKDIKNKEVLFPFLNGEDLNSRPDQSPSRWVINFFDWTLEQAEEYPDCFERVQRLVKPEREKQNREVRKKYWWRYGEIAPKLYRTIAPLKRVLVHPLTSKHHTFAFFPSHNIVFTQMTVIVALESWIDYAILQSELHWQWALRYGNKLETRPQYTNTDCFETFPFPQSSNPPILHFLESLGERYYEHRRQLMLARQEGLTKIYNRFHNPSEASADIVELRRLHVEMDNAVAAAYGWQDLALGHGFHETAQGVRYTLSETARREVLARLLKLNHERWEEEQKAEGSKPKIEGKIGRKAVKKKRMKKAGGEEEAGQLGLV